MPKWLRERSAKPSFGGSNPPVASNFFNFLTFDKDFVYTEAVFYL